ncbi:MAG: caspase family protein [Chloroflexota bacterium]
MTKQFSQGYALLIGVSQSQESGLALPDVAQDISAIRRVLAHPQRCAYDPANLLVLQSEQATRQGILDGLAWLQEKLAAHPDGNATAVIYYSGHGWCEQKSQAYYLIPYDVNLQRLRLTALRADDFAASISDIQPRRLLVVLDCCHAGGMGVKDPFGAAVPAGYAAAAIPAGLVMDDKPSVGVGTGAKGIEQLEQGSGRAVLSSSRENQSAYLRRDRQMSIFTYHLIESLTGHAAHPADATEVLVSDVIGHVHRRVPASAKAEYDTVQQPDYRVSGNFPVALLLGGRGIRKGQPAPDPLADLEDEPAAPVDASYRATLAGNGVIVQGNNNTTVGAGGVLVKGSIGGDVVTGKKITQTAGDNAIQIGQSRDVKINRR